MRKYFATGLLALLLALLPMAAFAQTGVTLQTTFQVQNLGSGPAIVTVTYYSPDGTVAATQTTDPIASGGSFTFIGDTLKVPAGFKGSAVISADQPIAAISNVVGLTSDGSRTVGSYNGFTGGATSLGIPIVQRGNSGISTFVAVQNAGTAAANVSITYTPAAGANNGTANTQTAAIAPGASYIFDQASNTALGTRFVGAATVTSTNSQPIVATVSQIGQNSPKIQSTYDAFTSGSATVLLPLIMAYNGANQSFVGIQIQNIGTADTVITVKYSPNVATGGNLCPTPPDSVSTAITAGASYNLLTANNPQFAPGNCKYVGSATVTNSASQSLVAIVNQLDLVGAIRNGSAYEGFNPASATKNLSVPLVQANNSNIFSTIQVQNTGAAPANITITYSTNNVSGGTACGTRAPVIKNNIPVGGSVTVFNNLDLPTAGCRFVGSATVVSDQNVVGVVNQLGGPGNADTLTSYNAFNQ